MQIILRTYKPEDLAQIVTLFRDTIHTVNVKDYSADQINAWAPETIDAEKWGTKLLEHYTVVAEYNSVICGFGDLHNNGYLDHLFTHKDYQGRGVATKIVKAIEVQAKILHLKKIFVHVSITAKTFFIKQGYTLITPQEVHYNDQVFTNFVMEKNL